MLLFWKSRSVEINGDFCVNAICVSIVLWVPVIAIWEFMDISVGPLGFGIFCYDFNVGARQF